MCCRWRAVTGYPAGRAGQMKQLLGFPSLCRMERAGGSVNIHESSTSIDNKTLLPVLDLNLRIQITGLRSPEPLSCHRSDRDCVSAFLRRQNWIKIRFWFPAPAEFSTPFQSRSGSCWRCYIRQSCVCLLTLF